MKAFVTTFALAMGVAFSAAALFADDKAPGIPGGGGGGAPAAADRAANRAENKVEKVEKATNQNEAQVQQSLNKAENQAARQINRAENQADRQVDRAANQANRQFNRDENQSVRENDRAALRANANDRARLNVDVNGRTRVNIGRDAYVDRKAHLGDRDFDRRGIGPLDDTRFNGRADNNWRYRRWGNEWWYWTPASAWMFYRDGRWNNYDADSYVDVYANPSYGNVGQVSANFNGPYYEDSNGFYYMQGGRRVYDPQIRRVGEQIGTAPTATPR
jgi:hypothetical protein